MASDPSEIDEVKEERRKASSSPWKKATPDDSRPVIESEAWPALADAKIKVANAVPPTPLPPPPPQQQQIPPTQVTTFFI